MVKIHVIYECCPIFTGIVNFSMQSFARFDFFKLSVLIYRLNPYCRSMNGRYIALTSDETRGQVLQISTDIDVYTDRLNYGNIYLKIIKFLSIP